MDAAATLGLLGLNHVKQKKYAEAEPHLRECLALWEKNQPDSWLRFYTQSLLGEALAGQKKYAEAEPLLVQGYEGMRERKGKIPAYSKILVTKAQERLAPLYEAWGKPEKAAQWREKRD